MAKKWLKYTSIELQIIPFIAILGNNMQPFLGTSVMKQIVAMFGNFVKQNIARNGDLSAL